MTRDRQRRYDLEQLEEQLWKAANRRLREVFKDPDGRDDAVYPVLARIAKAALPATWQEDPTRALIRLMRAAIARLPDEKPKDCATTWKDMGTVLYGFRTDLPAKLDATPYSYKNYVAVARKEAGLEYRDRTFRRIVKLIRKLLATELLAIESDVVNGALDLETITAATSTSGSVTGSNPEPNVADARPATSVVAASDRPHVGGSSVALGKTRESPQSHVEEVSTPPLRQVEPKVKRAIRDLANVVRRQWAADRSHRDDNDFLLPSHSVDAPKHYMDHWVNIGSREPIHKETFASVADKFLSVPSGRFVILGQAGAGKTTLAIELLLSLLEQEWQINENQVPVILNPASWNPRLVSLEAWLCGKLSSEYLTTKSFFRRGTRVSPIAARLVEDHHILPILDGFDEMAPELQAAAIRAINHYRGNIVVTSRKQAYFDAIDTSGVLKRADVIELRSLTRDDVESHLKRGARPKPDATTRWHPVFSSIRDDQTAPLFDVFTTPFMVSLAASIYNRDNSTDPIELLDQDRFPDAAALSDYLIGQFIRIKYEDPLPDQPRKRSRSWTVVDAQRWLRFLAMRMHVRDTRDLAWWDANIIEPTVVRVTLANVALWVTIASLGVELLSGAASVALVALVVGMTTVFATLDTIFSPSKPKTLHCRHEKVRYLLPPVFVIALALAFGISIGIVSGIGVGSLLLALAASCLAWLACLIMGVPSLRITEDPGSHLRADRTAALARGAGYGVLGFWPPLLGSLLEGSRSWSFAAVGCLLAVLTGIAFVWLASFSGTWFVSRVWLAVSKKLPWPQLQFLEDAYDRGVLRRVGTAYQFRHAALQDYLGYEWLKAQPVVERKSPDVLQLRRSLARRWRESRRFRVARGALEVLREDARSVYGTSHVFTSLVWFELLFTLRNSTGIDAALFEIHEFLNAHRQILESGSFAGASNRRIWWNGNRLSRARYGELISALMKSAEDLMELFVKLRPTKIDEAEGPPERRL